MRGDVILYKSSGRWYERAIALATHGPYVHVAVQMDTTHVIAAGTSGIALFPMPVVDVQHTLVSLRPGYASEAQIEQGVQWAVQHAGVPYGWADIAYQAVKFLAPNNPFRFGEEGHWDCSDFATRYLLHAGVQLPDQYSDPYANTPNDLARLFGLLPARK